MTAETGFWYLSDSGARHPHDNMALDEALLHLPAGHPVVLRFYDWNPPGLSLGYFQKHDEPPGPDAARYGAVLTRRSTGGGAILHAGEITFSIAGDEGRAPFNGTIESSYHLIHDAIAKGLQELGITARLRESRRIDQGSEPEAGRCFYKVTGYDLVARGRKLVGSAQRRTGGRVIHHGTIPIDPNPMTPASASVRELAKADIPPERKAIQQVICEGFEKVFKIRLEKWQPGLDVEQEAARLAAEKYATDPWIRRR